VAASAGAQSLSVEPKALGQECTDLEEIAVRPSGKYTIYAAAAEVLAVVRPSQERERLHYFPGMVPSQ